MKFINLFEKYADDGKLLGSGSFGVVFQATKLKTGAKVAVKAILVRELQSDAAVNRITSQMCSEADLMVALKKSANIIDLFKCCFITNSVHDITHLCLVMPLCVGSLRDLLAKGFAAITPTDHKVIMRSLLKALAYVHKKGFVHADVKPTNVLVDQRGVIKLADFGAATKHSHKPRRFCGSTMVFMPPEMAYECSNYHEAAYLATMDIWAAGMVMFQLWAGGHMFTEASIIRLGQKYYSMLSRRGAMSYWHDTKIAGNIGDQQAADLVKRLAQLNPANRPTASDILRHQFLATKKKALRSKTMAAVFGEQN